MDAQTVPGRLTRVYIDREHVKEAQGAARPWVVEQPGIFKFRCRTICDLSGAHSQFDIHAKPSLWLETTLSVQMFDVEVLA